MKLLLIDNFDSFVYNLAQALRSLGAEVSVVRNDAISIGDVRVLAPDALVISPGPGRPDDPRYFGVCAELIREHADSLPILGVCLGHQGIVHVLGGHVVQATRVMHGKSSEISHCGTGLFEGLPQRFTAMRYHSLVAEVASMPASLNVTAHADDGAIMGVSHCSAPLHGVQFHPESSGTPLGPRVLDNFLRLSRAHTQRS
jgi:anthranilate synthase/aminodeoxychorismate synthase-like glutamine amidotransferase